MSLQLEQDAKVPIQTHIDEFSSRFAIMIFLWIVVTIFWITNIDVVLEKIILALDPCVDQCTNLYNPAKWSEIRWLSAALLGFVSISPLLVYQIYVFSRPGMMNREAKWLLAWLIMGSITFIINIAMTIFIFMPYLFEIGHSNQIKLGFEAKYDVVAMLTMAMAVIWVEVLILSGVIALVTAGLSGLMHQGNSRWWRLRVHGIISMLILLSFYGQVTFSLTIIGLSFASIELISMPWIKARASMLITCPVIFDEFGVTRKVLFAQCECDNDYTLPRDYDTDNAYISFKSICNNKNEKENLYQIIETNNFTDFVIFGCSSTNLIEQIENNLFTSKCKLRTDLFSLNSKSFSGLEHYSINSRFLMDSIIDPWNSTQAISKLLSRIRKYKKFKFVICHDNYNIDMMEIENDEVIIKIPKDKVEYFSSGLDEIGCKYRLVDS
jgi:Sec-independent protein secretion pathway component TatC